jgi:hypothetical protein
VSDQQTRGYFDPALNGDQLPGQARIDIAFGPRPNQVLTPETASAVLTLWCERAPARFGAYLAEVLTGTKPTSVRGK